MKTLIAFVLLATTLACATCNIYSRKQVKWVGGHQESLYCSVSGNCFWLNGGYELPHTILYDDWTGRFCR